MTYDMRRERPLWLPFKPREPFEVSKVDPETAILYVSLLAETPAVPAESLPPLAQALQGP